MYHISIVFNAKISEKQKNTAEIKEKFNTLQGLSIIQFIVQCTDGL